ncbi:VOC family protein [Ammonicoccus fulvus]|uniref:VOC family protein n=1 Tax=Ammonicoccus fulvus TaxID=3138240 RepID=A0ABZ3FJ79_9ACTN
MPIAELGHVGILVNDLPMMKKFYTEVMGLTVTDEDPDAGLTFMSARPDVEHHEFLLAPGRTADTDAKLIQQISFRVDSLESLLQFHKVLNDPASGAKVQQEVTHGNAFGIYFHDPEGNRVEVYLRLDDKVTTVPQPYRKHMNFDATPDEIWKQAEELLAAEGPTYPNTK